MKKNEVIKAMCALSMQVGGEVFQHSVATDCFCEDAKTDHNFQFQSEAVDFIQLAVEEKIARTVP